MTAADSAYFFSLITLLTTLKHSSGLKELEVDVWNLGLSDQQIRILSCIDFLKVKEFEEYLEPFPGAFGVSKKSFCWKPIAIENSMSRGKGLLWIDAGVAVSSSLSEFISKNDSPIFIRNNNYINKDWTSKDCSIAMNASTLELESCQLHGNILYFDPEDKNSLLILRAWVYWASKELASVSDDPQHRNDQSILSILAARHGISLIDQQGIVQEDEKYQESFQSKNTFLAHRRTFSWLDLNALINFETETT